MTRNQLTGALPTQLSALTNLTNLRLEDNRLSGPIPSQLSRLTNLRKVYLTRNAGFTGCVPPRLREVRFNDIATLNLPNCASDAPETPETPLPAYTLTVTAGDRRRRRPSGRLDPHRGHSRHPHRKLERRDPHLRRLVRRLRGLGHDLHAGDVRRPQRHAGVQRTAGHALRQPEDADCIRAVYLGAPDDYAQVQDIPAELLLTPNADGRYVVERGQQVTVVTAAPLPSNHDRFIPDIRPDSTPGPTSYLQLVPPVGTTYSLTASGDAYAADRLEFHLRAALTRPGSSKPIPGAVVVTTAFEVLPDPLALALASSSELCTANTLAELSWTISGGKAPYTLTIDGETVDPEADSHRVNCGSLMIDPFTQDPLPNQTRTFSAVASDSQSPTVTVTETVTLDLALALPAVGGKPRASASIDLVGFKWNEIPVPPECASEACFGIRWRQVGATDWNYEPYSYKSRHVRDSYVSHTVTDLQEAVAYEGSVAAIRDWIELETPEALNWNEAIQATTITYPSGLIATATHDSVTVQWDRQPTFTTHSIYLYGPDGGLGNHIWSEDSPKLVDKESGYHRVVFRNLPPGTEFKVMVKMRMSSHSRPGRSARTTITTMAAPPGTPETPRGAQNLRATATEDSVTISWDLPFPEPNPEFVVYLIDVAWQHSFVRYVSGTAFTFDGLPPGREYLIYVRHQSVDAAERQISVTTLEAQSGSRGETLPRGELPIPPTEPGAVPIPEFVWPHALETPGRWSLITEDAWVARGSGDSKYWHGGIDTGVGARGSYLQRIQAIRAGTAREFLLPAGASVGYCPGSSLGASLRAQVQKLGANEHHFDLGGRRIPCTQLLNSDHGRAVLTLHEYSGQLLAVLYAHLSQFVDDQGAREDPLDDGRRVAAGEVVGIEGDSGYSFARHLHLTIRRFFSGESVESIVGNSWREVHNTSPTWFCGNVAEDELDTIAYCPYHVSRHIRTMLEPEQVLPPPPPATRFTYAGHPADQVFDPAITSGVPQEQSFEVDNVYKRFLVAGIMPGPSGSLTVEFDAAAWRPLAYTYYESGMPERFQQPGVEGTSDGVIGYVVRSDCQASAASPPLSPTAYAQDRFWSEVLPVRIPASVGLGDRCAFWLATYNETFPAPASLPVGAYGRNADKSSFIPERLSAVVEVHAGRLSPGTAVEIADELRGIQFKVYEFVAVAGRAPRFETVLVGTHPIPDIVLEVWNSTGRVAHKAHPIAGPVILDNWTPAASGRHFLVARGGYVAAQAVPAQGTFTLRYDLAAPAC